VNVRNEVLEEGFLDLLAALSVPQEILALFSEIVRDVWKQRSAEALEQRRRLASRLEDYRRRKDALVDAFLNDAIVSPTRYAPETGTGEDLVRRVEECAAEGVLFCAPSFCDPALLDQPMAVAAVEAAGIPWTSFKYSENTGQFQVIREQAGTFSDSIKLWSEAKI